MERRVGTIALLILSLLSCTEDYVPEVYFYLEDYSTSLTELPGASDVFEFVASEKVDFDVTVNIHTSGSAIEGVDYVELPDQIVLKVVMYHILCR